MPPLNQAEVPVQDNSEQTDPVVSVKQHNELWKAEHHILSGFKKLWEHVKLTSPDHPKAAEIDEHIMAADEHLGNAAIDSK